MPGNVMVDSGGLGSAYSAFLNQITRQPTLLGQSGSQYLDYFNQNPDLQEEWRRLSTDGTAARRGWTTPEQYAQWHWQTYGQSEGRTMTTTPTTPAPVLGDAVRLTDAEQSLTRVPQRSDTEIQEIARMSRLGEQRRGGRGSTILTGNAGVNSAFQAGRPQLRQAGIMR